MPAFRRNAAPQNRHQLSRRVIDSHQFHRRTWPRSTCAILNCLKKVYCPLSRHTADEPVSTGEKSNAKFDWRQCGQSSNQQYGDRRVLRDSSPKLAPACWTRGGSSFVKTGYLVDARNSGNPMQSKSPALECVRHIGKTKNEHDKPTRNSIRKVRFREHDSTGERTQNSFCCGVVAGGRQRPPVPDRNLNLKARSLAQHRARLRSDTPADR